MSLLEPCPHCHAEVMFTGALCPRCQMDRHAPGARMLLEKGAKPGIKPRDGMSPLQLAINRKQPKLATLLREYGAREATAAAPAPE